MFVMEKKEAQEAIDDLMVLLSLNNFLKHLYCICDPEGKTLYICIDGCTSINKLN